MTPTIGKWLSLPYSCSEERENMKNMTIDQFLKINPSCARIKKLCCRNMKQVWRNAQASDVLFIACTQNILNENELSSFALYVLNRLKSLIDDNTNVSKNQKNIYRLIMSSFDFVERNINDPLALSDFEEVNDKLFKMIERFRMENIPNLSRKSQKIIYQTLLSLFYITDSRHYSLCSRVLRMCWDSAMAEAYGMHSGRKFTEYSLASSYNFIIDDYKIYLQANCTPNFSIDNLSHVQNYSLNK